jgi:TM2 domain-containing membrane protein YozV
MVAGAIVHCLFGLAGWFGFLLFLSFGIRAAAFKYQFDETFSIILSKVCVRVYVL